MKIFVTLATALSLASPALAQTKSADGADGYASYVSGALACMAAAPGDASAQDSCIVAAVKDCESKAGVYEACIEALREGFDAAILRVEAEELKLCEGKLDTACAAVLRGHALIRSGQGLDAAGWSHALTETD